MNDKTRKPNEPDGRGRVATGESAAAGGADTKGGAAPADPQVTNGAAASAGSPGPESAGGADDGAATSRTKDDKSDVPARPDPEGPEAVTTELRLPTSANGSASRPVPGAPGDGAATTKPDKADAARPAENGVPVPKAAAAPPPGPPNRRPATAPAPPTPPPPTQAPPAQAPSPQAPATPAGPPPWNRIPGKAAPERFERAGNDRPAGGLLEDAPTTFLEPPALPGVSSDADAPGSEGEGASAGRPRRSRPPRQAALQLKRLDPWSVLKLALVLAVVLFFIWMVAVGVLYGVLDGMGVWDRLNGTYADLVSGEAPTGSPLISAGRVFGLAAVIGAINSLLFAVAVTIGAFVYNVSADLVGGIEVTLSERD
ncbi:hypothetical protein GCM10010464_16910 [Pseudonocardia yunnanensis]|uniref:DUF3566 domain-containing protein n=1 Tax=Pseudonocardia yunnanensis TaxID=58107 RepID=A0ABW4ETQ6_9PSEU